LELAGAVLELVWTAPSSAFLTSSTTRGTPRVTRICAVSAARLALEQHYVTAPARGLHGFSLRGGGQEEEGARHEASKLIWHPTAQTTPLLSEAHMHSS